MTAEKKRAGHIFPIAGMLIALVVLIGAGIYFYGIKGQASSSGGAMGEAPFAGETAPNFTLTSLDGKTVSLSDYRGQVVFLNFFATWCDPCKAELPDFNRMNNRMKDEGMKATFLLVNVQQQPDEVQAFMKQNGYTMTVLTDVSGAVAAKYLVSGIPATFIVGPDGKIITKRVGTISASLLETYVQQVVK